MIKDFRDMTYNARLVCMADFFWNIGRTLPHAILTIYLFYSGCTLIQIASLQTVFMITAMITEFPSGIMSDITSRKSIYLLSLMMIFVSFLLIGFNAGNFPALILAYILYGFSESLKSGTLEAEVVLEYRHLGRDVKTYSITSSYMMSISSIAGGLLGSILYACIGNKIYVFSLILFMIAFFVAKSCRFEKEKSERNSLALLSELKIGIDILKSAKLLIYLLCLFALTSLFLQPFYQYWQILYQEKDIDVKYFGIIYIVFQLCNIVGVAIYKNIEIGKNTINILIVSIPILFAVGSCIEKGVIVALPIVVTIFFVFYQHLDVINKKYAPKEALSSFFSLVGTSENITSSVSLFLMALCMPRLGTPTSYLLMFSLFSVLSLVVWNLFKSAEDKSKNHD